MYFGAQRPQVFNPLRDIVFKIFAPQHTSFYLLCAYAAYNISKLRGEQECPDALRYKIAAIQSINRVIDDPTKRYSERSFISIATFIWLEHGFGTRTSAEFRIHYNGLRQILRARGGLSSFRENWRFHIASPWLFLLLSADHIANFRHILDTQDPTKFDTETALEFGELSQHAQNLLGILADLQRLKIDSSSNLFYSSEQSAKVASLRALLFAPGTSVHTFLSQEFLIIPVPKRRSIKETIQLFCLLYLNLAFLDCRHFSSDSSSKTLFFLSRLHDEVIETDVTSIEYFTWTLLRDLDGVLERKEKLVWMVQVTELLTGETRKGLKNFLLGNLEPQGRESRGSSSLQIELDLEGIRGELERYLDV